MRNWAIRLQDKIEDIRRRLLPAEAPHLISPEEFYEQAIKRGDSEEWARQAMEYRREDNIHQMARWENREREKQDPEFIAQLRMTETAWATQLAKQQQEIAKEEANPDFRYKALTRMTELATQRLLAFAGDPQVERERGARVLLHLRQDPHRQAVTGARNRPGVHPGSAHFRSRKACAAEDRNGCRPSRQGGSDAAFREAYARYAEAKAAAERSLGY
jgi:hypothetical protein